MYRGLIQSVLRLDRVNSSSCDYSEKILVYLCSNASCLTPFSSGISSPEVAEFCPALRLVYDITRVSASTCAFSSVYSLPCNNFVQKVVSQVENLSIFVIAFKDLCVSCIPKKLLLFHRQLTRPWACAFTWDS
jgi:hypothetical protein